MHRLFLAMALPWLAGCQTDGTVDLLSATRAALSGNEAATPASARYGAFYDQGDHLRDLLAAKRFDDAAVVVDMRWSWFEPRLEPQAERLRAVAQHINAREQARLDAAAASLADAADFHQVAHWPELKRLRAEAKEALAGYDKMALLRRPEFRSDHATALEAAVQRFDEAGRNAAPAAFALYDHGAELGFFAGYPVELDRPAILRAQMTMLDERARQLAPDAVLRWHRSLSRDVQLDSEQRARFGRWLADAVIRASGARRPGWKEVREAWRVASENGLPPSLPERPRMRVVVVASGQPGGDGGTRTQLAGQNELAAENLPLEAALADNGSDLLLLIAPGDSRSDRSVMERKSVTSRYVAGERTIANPAYEAARLRAIQAERERAGAQYRAAVASAQPRATTLDGLSAVVNSLAQAVQEQKLERAIAEMQTMPPTLQEPVYDDYRYEVVAVKANRAAEVAWHVLDRTTSTWRQGDAKVEEAKTFSIAYRLHETDPRRQQILREHQTEEALVAWSDAAMVVPLGTVLNAAISGSSTERKLGSFAQAGSELRRQQTMALAAARPAPAAQAATSADARMNSVVMIRTPDSHGAGFYVTPETVVTNAHVVRQHRFVDVKLRDGRESFGRVMAVEPYADLAIIRTEARGTAAKLAGGEPLVVGSTIDVIGHPKGLQFSLSRGVVSALRKQRISSVPGAGPVLVIQTDAAASPGNSGGPWFLQGEVVAVTSYKQRDGESLNFGIHVSELRDFLRKHGIEIP